MAVKKKRKTRRARTVSVEIDVALKKAWDAALSTLESSARQGMRGYDRKYEVVGTIVEHDPPLYLAGGVSSLAAFVRKYLPGEDARSVLRNVRVARYASPDQEKKYGTSKVDAAIDYLEAKIGKPVHGRIPVDFAKLRIPVEKGTVLFKDATVRQIRDAARAIGRGKRARARAKAKASPVVVEIVKRLPRGAKGVTVHYSAGRVTIGRIPVARFVSVLRALAAARLPTG